MLPTSKWSCISDFLTPLNDILLSINFAELEQSPEFSRGLKEYNGDSRKVALYLATRYMNWVESKQSTTTDDVFRMVLNFVTMMTKFKHMVMAVRSGDSIMIKSMYIEMLPVFEVAAKKITLKYHAA